LHTAFNRISANTPTSAPKGGFLGVFRAQNRPNCTKSSLK
jgi:hypothetical protein